MVCSLVHGNQLQDARQRWIAALIYLLAQVAVVEPGGQFLHHPVNENALSAVLGHLPFVVEEVVFEVGHLLFAAQPGAQQPVSQRQGMLGFLVAPVGVKPGPATVDAEQGKGLGDVIGQEQFHGTK